MGVEHITHVLLCQGSAREQALGPWFSCWPILLAGHPLPTLKMHLPVHRGPFMGSGIMVLA